MVSMSIPLSGVGLSAVFLLSFLLSVWSYLIGLLAVESITGKVWGLGTTWSAAG
jgi:hypothetical protein